MYNLTPQALVYITANWYNALQLLDEIYRIRNINFNIVEQRQQCLARLSKLARKAPFTREARFAEGLWVCESLGDWTRKIQQLKSALSFKDVDSQKKEVALEPRSDAQTAFWNSTTAIVDQITSLDNVITREVFESYYSEWVGNDQRFASSGRSRLQEEDEQPLVRTRDGSERRTSTEEEDQVTEE